MVNELEEFRAYTTFPEYKAARKNDTTYMGRFTFPMLLDFKGFQRIFTILARGFLFEDGGNGYDRIDYARRDLLAWCSVSTGRMQTQKKTQDQSDPGNQTNYAIYHGEFPNLVDETGDGWLIRHVENVTRFVTEHPEKVRKDAWENVCKLKQGFRRFWAKKVDHIQAVPFSENTKGKWGLRMEDILADALVLGPLQNRDFDLPENVAQRLTELTPKGVPPEASILLYKYYVIHRTSRSDALIPDWMLWPNQNDLPDSGNFFVVLPMQNFNAFFGTTAFSQKWITELTESILERKVLDGISKYQIVKTLL